MYIKIKHWMVNMYEVFLWFEQGSYHWKLQHSHHSPRFGLILKTVTNCSEHVQLDVTFSSTWMNQLKEGTEKRCWERDMMTQKISIKTTQRTVRKSFIESSCDSNIICNIYHNNQWFESKITIYMRLTAHNWQSWKSTFPSFPCHKIYREEAVGLKSSNYT